MYVRTGKQKHLTPVLKDTAAQDEADALPQLTLKCRVVFQRPDIFKGMRSLIEAGQMEAP
jgi:hypothetical protein